MVFKVTDAVTPPLDLKDPGLVASLAATRRPAAPTIVLTEYISGLQTQLGTKINQAALRAAPAATATLH